MLKWVATIKSNIDKETELVIESNTLKKLGYAIKIQSNMDISLTTLQNIYWGRAPALAKTINITKRYSSVAKLPTANTTSVGVG